MKSLFSLKTQVALGILVGLAVGYLFSTAPLPGMTGTPVPSPTPQPSPRPFVTLPGAWMVRIDLHRSAAPEVLKITRLTEGRMTVFKAGESTLQILDKTGVVLFEQSFHVDLVAGDPPEPVDDLNWTIVLPAIQGAHTLKVTTPNGEAKYDFPSQ